MALVFVIILSWQGSITYPAICSEFVILSEASPLWELASVASIVINVRMIKPSKMYTTAMYELSLGNH